MEQRMKLLNLASLSSLALAALLIPNSAWSLEYNLTTQLPASQKTIILNFLETGKSLLPKKVVDSVSKINVSFDDIELRDGVAVGQVSRFTGKMTLSKTLIKDIVAGESNSKQTNRIHKTVYKEAMATLLHETIHVYDNLNNHDPEEQKWMMKCRPRYSNENAQKSAEASLPAVCKYYKDMSKTLSENPYFLFTAGFIQDFNGLKERSPDIYELTNSQESLAVNMEYFLLDPQFKCRKPTMYRLLSSHFQHVPFAGVNCDSSLSFVLPNNGNDSAQMLNIDPARVYQIHYLLADKGDAMMSGWGHAMIRLVICAPGKPVGPDCMLDLDQHVVLSYRAFVDSLSLSSLDGMTGKYPSRLFIIPLSKIIDEYNKGELRALKSLPLKLSRKEIEDVVTRSVESHWSYNGKYYFISNNCATESLNLIRSAIFNFDLLQVDVKSPMDLYASFIRLGRADESVLKDQKAAMRGGYYFDSFEERYTKSFAFIKGLLNLPEQDFKAFLDLKAAKRRAYINRIPKNAPNALQIYANFMVLEAASQRRMQTLVTGQVQKIALEEMNAAEERRDKAAGNKKAMALKNIDNLAQKYLELGQLFAKPSDFLKAESGYGLPSKEESIAAQKGIQTNGQKATALEKSAQATIESLISSENLKEMEELKTNAHLLSVNFRALLPKTKQ
jgi:hypothetical protein